MRRKRVIQQWDSLLPALVSLSFVCIGHVSSQRRLPTASKRVYDPELCSKRCIGVWQPVALRMLRWPSVCLTLDLVASLPDQTWEQSSVSFRLFSPPSLVAGFPGPKKFRPPLCGGRLGPHLFSLREVPYAFLRYRHVLFWLGSQFATPGSQCGPSDAPQRPQRPQRPLFLCHNLGLRGPSEAAETPQRPLRGPCWVTIWASEAWVSFWAWEGGGTAVAQIVFLHHTGAAIASSKIFFRKKWRSKGLFTPLQNTFSATKTVTFQPN